MSTTIDPAVVRAALAQSRYFADERSMDILTPYLVKLPDIIGPERIEERVTLAPGDIRTLRFVIPAAARRYWSTADRSYVLDESTFDVWVGGDSTAELHAEFVVRVSAG